MPPIDTDHLAALDAMPTLSIPARSRMPRNWPPRSRAAAAGRYDELRGSAAGLNAPALAPAWRSFFTSIGSDGVADLDRRADAAPAHARNGLFYQLHEQRAATARPARGRSTCCR